MFFSDNPYDVADKWLLSESLPLSYRQQIVEFILQNSGQRDLTLDSSFRDPFTGCEYFAIMVLLHKYWNIKWFVILIGFLVYFFCF